MITQESAALAAWYGSRPEIRRLLAMQDSQGLRVLVDLEPTHDGNETHVAWLANRDEWTDELQLHIGGAVRLEHVDEFLADEVETDVQGVIVAELSWRDPSVI